ncbi:MAG TPA: TMEM175 family protein [Pelobium sp.]|nr:TMEM175 family protein [Pelobium sp.]
MNKTRMEAFSDGVLAIIITIMVLEIKVPHGAEFADLKPLIPVVSSYVLSFIYVGIYWNNHHHMMHTVKNVSGGILWANLHLLFWLSLIPFATGWLGENHLTALPLALYGFVLLMAAIAYWILQSIIIKQHGNHSILGKAVGKDLKGKASPIIYTLGILASFWVSWLAITLYVVVALMWLIPDKRIEIILTHQKVE